MSNQEKILIKSLEYIRNKNSAAVIIQNFIQLRGPLSEEAGEKVREILAAMEK